MVGSERGRVPFPIHPHMLRHACRYALANTGQDTRRLQAYSCRESLSGRRRKPWSSAL